MLEKFEQRLCEQGFRTASVENGEIVLNGDWTDATLAEGYPTVTLVKSGKMVVLSGLGVASETAFVIDGTGKHIDSIIGKIPNLFAPDEEVIISDYSLLYRSKISSSDIILTHKSGFIKVRPNGEIYADIDSSDSLPSGTGYIKIVVGSISQADFSAGAERYIWIKTFGEES